MGKDYLAEFKAISIRNKKRFLRKPNFAEASQQYHKLALKMRDSESSSSPHYEAVCHVAAAKCQQQAGNLAGQVEALVGAARTARRAEFEVRQSMAHSFLENLSLAVDCYCAAIRILEENGDSAMAASLLLELAETFRSLGRTDRAAELFRKAAGVRSAFVGLDHVQAQERVAECLVDVGDFHGAVLFLSEVADLAERLAPKPVCSVYLDILQRCEVLRVLLLLLIGPSPTTLGSEVTAAILEKYAWEFSPLSVAIKAGEQHSPLESGVAGSQLCPRGASSGSLLTDKSLAELGNKYLSDELFLLLQSVVMAVEVNDIQALAELEDHLVPLLTSEPQQRDLLRLLVRTMKDKSV